jgi:phosphatidylserine decarboxylase
LFSTACGLASTTAQLDINFIVNQAIAKSDSEPSLPPVAPWPKWFERLPFACWGWRELNLYGWPLLATTIVVALLARPWCWLAVVPGVLLALLLYFFRDPRRQIPNSPSAIVSPADGRIVEVTALPHYDFIGGPAVRIGIFLSIFNVHINRAPVAARVVEMNYRPGKFLNALNPQSAEQNEFMWIGLETTDSPPRRFTVRQISGLLARRIVCPLRPGANVTRGEKFGMIKLGSRTELILPAGAVEVEVSVGDNVRAGSDIVARWT